EHRLDPGGHELVGHRLRGLRGNRQDRDLDCARLDLTRHVPRGHDGHALDVPPDLRGIVVEDDRNAEPLAAEALVMEQGGAQVAEPHERHRPLAVEAENPLELGLEPGHVVADAPHAELAEIREVLAHLRGVQVEAFGELLRRDRADAVLLELEQAACVHRETTDRHLRNLRKAVSRPRHGNPEAPGASPAPGARRPVYLMGWTKSRIIATTST